VPQEDQGRGGSQAASPFRISEDQASIYYQTCADEYWEDEQSGAFADELFYPGEFDGPID
jgi:hypothetical protein